MIDRIARLLGEHGLILRGGFHPTAEDDLPDNTRTLLLVGNAGSALWGPFSDARGHLNLCYSGNTKKEQYENLSCYVQYADVRGV